MILVDSSVLIDFFNKKINDETEILFRLVKNRENIAINSIILLELLQGEKNKKKLKEIEEGLNIFKLYEINHKTIINAIAIARACQNSGKTIKTVDLVIATNAIENNLELFHKDKHFDIIVEVTGLLKVYKG